MNWKSSAWVWPKAGGADCALSCGNSAELLKKHSAVVSCWVLLWPRYLTSTMTVPREDKALRKGAFSVAIRKKDAVSILDVLGRLTSFEIGALREAVGGLLKEGRNNIVLNLVGLEYLDSSGIGELAKSYVSVVKAGGQMKVVGLSAKVEEVLKVTQLYRVFPEFPSEEEALSSFPRPSG